MLSKPVGRGGDAGAGSTPGEADGVANRTPDEESTQDSSDSGSESSDETVSEGVVFDILRNERRRRVLKYLEEQDGHTTLGEMAEHLAAIENDKPRSQITSQERKRLYVGLYQCHLPRMDKAGSIDFDGDRGTIDTTEHTQSFLEYLPNDGSEEEPDTRWTRYYFTISAVGAGLLVLNAVGGVVGSQLLLGVVVFAVGLCSTLHWYTTTVADAADSDAS